MYQGKKYILNTYYDSFGIVNQYSFKTINKRNIKLKGISFIYRIKYVKFLK